MFIIMVITIFLSFLMNIIKEELSETGEKVGIELENDEDLLEPFNPEEISIQQKAVPMDVIIRRIKQNSIKLSPSFQRKEVWNNTRKSRLIESIMLNIPLPMFYVAADENGVWEVVDGLQRLSAIRDFLMGNQALSKLEFLGDKFDGKKFSEIEGTAKYQKLVNDIYETEMRFTVINPGTPEAVKRNIFKRINTGGMPLTSQEIRQALYEGKSSDLLSELFNSQEFIQAVGKVIDDSRMAGTELILRLIAFIVFNRKDYKAGMDDWLSNTMRLLNCYPTYDKETIKKIFVKDSIPRIKTTDLEEIKEKFILAMNRSKNLFGEHAFRKSLPTDVRKSPINKSLFEAWGVILSSLSTEDYEKLIIHRESFLEEYSKLFKKLDFNNAISRHSSTVKGVTDRYSYLENLVNEISGKSSD